MQAEKTIPRPDVMAALAQTLNVPTSWLAEGQTREDNPAQTKPATTATIKGNTTEASSEQTSGTAATLTEEVHPCVSQEILQAQQCPVRRSRPGC